MNKPETFSRLSLPLSILSGLLLALAYPYPDLTLVAFVALVPFLASLRRASRAEALLRGYACGAVFFFALLYWVVGVMRTYGGLPWPAAVLVLALLVFYLASYFALFAIAVASSWRRFGVLGLLASPVIWVGLELVRARILTGFPWGLLGYSQVRNLALLQVASVGGIYAVSFLVMVANVAVALLFIRPLTRSARVAAVGLGLLVIGGHAAGLGMVRQGVPAGGQPVRVAAIQGNVEQETKWSSGETDRIVGDLLSLTRQAVAEGATVIVWPESASPLSLYVPVRDGASAGAPMRIEPHPVHFGTVTGLARDLEVSLIAGNVDYRIADGGLNAFNSAFAVQPDGSIGGSYDKIHLVPFGEYVPLKRLLFFVDRMVEGAIADFTPGSYVGPLPTSGGDAAVFICYEAIFPELVRRLARRSAFMVNITNDAWFGRSAAADQHLAMAVVRAVENRRYMVRAANTGISAIIDSTGRILRRTGLYETAVLHGTLVTRRDITPYARLGDVFAGGCAILALLLAVALRAPSRRSASRRGARVGSR